MVGEVRSANIGTAFAIRAEPGSKARDALMAVGLLLTTATQLRLPGSPLGPGEFCLVIWIGLTLVLELSAYTPLTSALRRMLTFWVLFALALSLGILTALVIEDRHDPGLFWHDVLAYLLVAAFSCLAVIEPGGVRRLRRTMEIFAMVGAVCLTAQLLASLDLVGLPLIEPWFGDRFRGWSNNPNQLALLCAVLILVSLHLADTADRTGKRLAALLAIVPAIIVGRLTKTDTFTFSLFGAVPIYVMLKARFWLGSTDRKLSLKAQLAWAILIATPLMLASAAPFALSDPGGPDKFAMGLMKGGGKEASAETDLRLMLWGEAIDRGMQAYMLGLGPGPHLPIPAQIVAARIAGEPDPDPHPDLNGTPNFEAHNSPLDLFAQGGLLADAAFLWLVGLAWVVPYKARHAGLVALVSGVAIFGLTNNIVRPPIFWFTIAVCLISGDRPEGAHTSRRQS